MLSCAVLVMLALFVGLSESCRVVSVPGLSALWFLLNLLFLAKKKISIPEVLTFVNHIHKMHLCSSHKKKKRKDASLFLSQKKKKAASLLDGSHLEKIKRKRKKTYRSLIFETFNNYKKGYDLCRFACACCHLVFGLFAG